MELERERERERLLEFQNSNDHDDSPFVGAIGKPTVGIRIHEYTSAELLGDVRLNGRRTVSQSGSESFFFPERNNGLRFKESVCKIRPTFSPRERRLLPGPFFRPMASYLCRRSAARLHAKTEKKENSPETENRRRARAPGERRAFDVERKHRQVRRLSAAGAPFSRAIILDLKLPPDRVASRSLDNETGVVRHDLQNDRD